VIGSNDNEWINHTLSSFTRENEALYKQLMSIQYWFRGALNRDDSFALSYLERETYIEFINARFDSASDLMKKQIPVFI